MNQYDSITLGKTEVVFIFYMCNSTILESSAEAHGSNISHIYVENPISIFLKLILTSDFLMM